ncbi:MAG TPA: FAD-binding oxidoreductase [Gaiellaceae bacterium]|nr:FAD-binding oxidoreductase [Gaiellaceae bacterium]
MATIAREDELTGALQSRLRGEVLDPDHHGYHEARKLYNGMIDKRPRLIARCVDAGDVAETVSFARETGVDLAVRGGGHNGPGLGSVDDGLVIDLSAMRGVIVDPNARTARVLGGSLVGDVDHATSAYDLAAPFGVVSTTGVAGLTLGGGMGNLTRKLGLSIDNLLTADVVLADGSFVHASEDEHEDLFWALRGGGGNFGVVTAFTFRVSPVPPVVAGPTLWTLDRAEEIMRWYRDFLPAAPDELGGWFAFLTVPPVDPFPKELQLQKVCGVVWCYGGPPEDADEAFRPVRELDPDLDGLTTMPVAALNAAFDPLYPAGDQWYWRADFFDRIPDDAIDAHIEFAHRLPTPQSTMHLYPVDGAASRVSADATAWAYRDARWGQVMVGVDPDPARADELKEWTIAYWEALHPHSMGGAYVNMMMEEGVERIRATYRGNYDRLAQVKRKYDPLNLFHVNQNIAPA